MAEKSREELLAEYDRIVDFLIAKNPTRHDWADQMDAQFSKARAAVLARMAEPAPVPMILHCPSCGTQHVDEPDERTPGWTNPPHRSHLCHSCGTIWRPSDVATVGVRAIKTKGKADTWDGTAPAARMCGPGEVAISRASLATLFASYCRDKKAPVNFEVTVMPQYGADRSWIVQAWGDVHAVLRGPG